MRIWSGILCIVFALCTALVPRAHAQDSISFLRDAEMEHVLRAWMTPVWKAAGLDPTAVHVYVINDPTLNSFVAGGQNIFLNSGTIMKAQNANQLIGVMAHETGHIAGGHLARKTQIMKNAMIESVIGMVLGGAASALGHGNSGGAGVLAGADVGQRAFLRNSVTIEASADQAALRYLDRTHQSARGLLEFFEILQQEEFLTAQHQDPYLIDHPLTEERVNYLREHVARSPYSSAKDPPEWVAQFNLVKAKLGAFLGAPSQVLAAYQASDNSEAARYARAIAYYRIPDLKNAIPTIDGLIKDFPNNPYYDELKGQMLFENGRVADAVAPYQRAVQIAPGEPLLNIELAQVQLETNDPKYLAAAKSELTGALRDESDNPDAWRSLAIVYGRSGDIGMAALAISEQNMAQGDYRQAIGQAQRAQQLLPAGPQRQRAQDLLAEAKRQQQQAQNK
ncbi:MAG TPA: M48 family metalloprotease [Stellaceae bacterium]|jgi:predicted Zn-dependent protease|nr:M48 family metalloprotease [Stellaceae bacterium]